MRRRCLPANRQPKAAVGTAADPFVSHSTELQQQLQQAAGGGDRGKEAQLRISAESDAISPPASNPSLCRQFRCGLAFRSGYALSGLRPVLQALGVAAGDQLCFVPAGRGAATISLRPAGTEAGAAAGSSGVAVNAAAAGDAAGNKSGAAALPQLERTGQQQALTALFGSDSE